MGLIAPCPSLDPIAEELSHTLVHAARRLLSDWSASWHVTIATAEESNAKAAQGSRKGGYRMAGAKADPARDKARQAAHAYRKARAAIHDNGGWADDVERDLALDVLDAVVLRGEPHDEWAEDRGADPAVVVDLLRRALDPLARHYRAVDRARAA